MDTLKPIKNNLLNFIEFNSMAWLKVVELIFLFRYDLFMALLWYLDLSWLIENVKIKSQDVVTVIRFRFNTF